jgi:hypothetical protein
MQHETGRGNATRLAWLGLLLGLAGIVAYFVVVFRFAAGFPGLRNSAAANWVVIGAGLVLSLLAVSRASTARRRLPGVLLGVNAVLAVAFAGLMYRWTLVPPGHPPAVGSAAPSFSVVDHTGAPARLADFRGNPLLLVFYRGHW